MSFLSVSKVLDTIQSQENWAKQRLFGQLLHHWPQVVGSPVAAHTRPLGIYRQVLQVAVSSPVWAQQLTFARRSILGKLQAALGTTTLVDIHFSTAHWGKCQHLGRLEGSESFISRNAPPQKTVPAHQQPPTSPQEAFQRWVEAVQAQQHSPCRCPQCGSPCTSWELDRWQMCRNCAVRHLFAFQKTP